MNYKTKEIYVVWTNSDRTEGRGYEYPAGCSDSYSKAKSLASGGVEYRELMLELSNVKLFI